MKKKIIFLSVLLVLLLSNISNAEVAMPSPQKVKVDGVEVNVSAYLINGNNYFKLRDLASVLRSTESSFKIGFDDVRKIVTITTGISEERSSDDLKPLPYGRQNAIISPQKIFLNGEEVSIKAYLINGNNFFMLRDLADKVNFKSDYDTDTRSVLIETKKSSMDYLAEKVKLQAFPIEGFQVRKYIYDIRYTVGNNVNATMNYDPSTGQLVLLTDDGENMQIGELNVFAKQGDNLKELKVNSMGILTYEEMQNNGISFSNQYAIVFFIKNNYDGELIPLLVLEH